MSAPVEVRLPPHVVERFERIERNIASLGEPRALAAAVASLERFVEDLREERGLPRKPRPPLTLIQGRADG